MGFDRLHSALQHHIVNSLGWTSLRPLQESAVDPLLDESDALLLAPTAGGKTEAAIFPVLSRMLQEDWRGLSVLYVCPIKALLNNLYDRLGRLTELVGRRAELWHGDVKEGQRNRIRAEPPDILLTTPESLEAQLVSTKTDPSSFFGSVRVIVVDEIHAFAGDDRGWHLLAVLARIEALTGQPLQRIGLSATVGNPDGILDWLSVPSRSGVVINPPADAATDATDITLDYVGSLPNAAQVIAQLHRGCKRLVFCDSRARVEELTQQLRARSVRTFVSHSSLGLQERRDAELAFAEGDDCVIVATSTLELGVDVGDLDYVIQIDAPTTVASFLQRLGRTGRRAGTTRNCLFLATRADALVRAAALLRMWQRGEVEDVQPPPKPAHILGQQLMALALQKQGITRHDWPQLLEPFLASAGLSVADGEAILGHMLERGLFFEDGGIIWFGRRGEQVFGRRHFMELLAVFASEPMMVVRHGRTEVGTVHPLSVAGEGEQRQLSLGGRPWVIVGVDWSKRVIDVVPGKGRGQVRWRGDVVPLGFDLCQECRDVLASHAVESVWSSRATRTMEVERGDFAFLREGANTLCVHSETSMDLWTFGGLLANSQIAGWVRQRFGIEARADNFLVKIGGYVRPEVLRDELHERGDSFAFQFEAPTALADRLKFRECLPDGLLEEMLVARFSARQDVQRLISLPLRVVRTSE